MRVVAFASEHVGRLTVQRMQIVPPSVTDAELAAMATVARSGHAFSGVGDDGSVYAICGVAEQWPGRGLAWALISATAGRHMLAIHRAVTRYLDGCPFDRVEAHVDAAFPAAIRWIESLGFRRETPQPMRSFTPDGRDCYLYARLRHG